MIAPELEKMASEDFKDNVIFTKIDCTSINENKKWAMGEQSAGHVFAPRPGDPPCRSTTPTPLRCFARPKLRIRSAKRQGPAHVHPVQERPARGGHDGCALAAAVVASPASS